MVEGPFHTPVLREEVMEGLQVKPGGRYIDCTLGEGGHAQAILEASAPDGRLLGVDIDSQALRRAWERLAPFGWRVTIAHSDFSQLGATARRFGFSPADGILFDLGLCSSQLSRGERGFSFGLEGPLDMRFNPNGDGRTAADLVNNMREEELAEILAWLGQEPRARAIARAIVRARPIQTTTELAALVERAVGRRRRLHPATKTFQALRIAVNDELGALEQALPQAVDCLVSGGRLAVISFHSLEDRLVKRYFQQEARDCICPPQMPICTCGHKARLRLITKRPLRPSPAELERNPRSRSAKLRIVSHL